MTSPLPDRTLRLLQAREELLSFRDARHRWPIGSPMHRTLLTAEQERVERMIVLVRDGVAVDLPRAAGGPFLWLYAG